MNQKGRGSTLGENSIRGYELYKRFQKYVVDQKA